MNEEVEVKDESSKPADVVWLEPSPVGGEFMRHAQAMEPASRVPVYKAFAIAPGFNVGMLRKMAENYKPKRIVVIDHGENGYEVRRLGNNDDVSLFYASIQQNEEVEESALESLQSILDEYKNLTFEEAARYKASISKQMKNDNVVSYSFIHKRLSKLSVARNSKDGETACVKRAIEEAKANGVLSELPPNLCKEAYKTSATIYRINKGGL